MSLATPFSVCLASFLPGVARVMEAFQLHMIAVGYGPCRELTGTGDIVARTRVAHFQATRVTHCPIMDVCWTGTGKGDCSTGMAKTTRGPTRRPTRRPTLRPTRTATRRATRRAARAATRKNYATGNGLSAEGQTDDLRRGRVRQQRRRCHRRPQACQPTDPSPNVLREGSPAPSTRRSAGRDKTKPATMSGRSPNKATSGRASRAWETIVLTPSAEMKRPVSGGPSQSARSCRRIELSPGRPWPPPTLGCSASGHTRHARGTLG